MLLTDIGFDLRYPSVVHEDKLTKNDGVTDKSKHINVRFHYIRQCVRDGTLRFVRIAGKDNPADFLTKAGSAESARALLSAAGVG